MGWGVPSLRGSIGSRQGMSWRCTVTCGRLSTHPTRRPILRVGVQGLGLEACGLEYRYMGLRDRVEG